MSTNTEARAWWASLPQSERDRLINEAWPLPKQAPDYSPAVKQAFRDWNEHRAYVDNGGNYRVRPEPATPTHRPKGKIAPWNKEVKQLFPSCREFHEAAQQTNQTGGGE